MRKHTFLNPTYENMNRFCKCGVKEDEEHLYSSQEIHPEAKQKNKGTGRENTELQNHRLAQVERDFKDHLIPNPCCGQGHLSLGQVVPNLIQPGLELVQGWGIHNLCQGLATRFWGELTNIQEEREAKWQRKACEGIRSSVISFCSSQCHLSKHEPSNIC